MILICGVPDESPTRMVIERLEQLSAPFVVLDERSLEDADLHYTIGDHGLSGEITVGPFHGPVEEIQAVFARFIGAEASSGPGRARPLLGVLHRFLEVTPALVVNRVSAMASNGSKPYQAARIAAEGFLIPETLITNVPALVREMVEDEQPVIYKSASGVRSIVHALDDTALSRLDSVRACPTQFQRFVPGDNVRVHVVGEEVFATRIESNVVDYRYAERAGGSALLSPIELSTDLTARCVRLAAALDLPFAGIDLKLTADGPLCFEVNPSPGYSYFEMATGQPISEAVARLLFQADASR